MAPEKTGWNGPRDRPSVGKARRLSIQCDLDLVDVSRDAVAQNASNERVNEFAERAMVERERLRVEVRLAPVKRVLPDEPQRIAEKPMERRRGLNFRQGVRISGWLERTQPVMRGVLLTVPPARQQARLARTWGALPASIGRA